MHEPAEIPHNTLIVVGDGRKALFLRNLGAQMDIKLEVERRLLRTGRRRANGTRSTGPHSNPAMRERRGADHGTRSEEDLFETRLPATSARACCGTEPYNLRIAIVLSPKALGHLRSAMSAALQKHVIAEIPKDLTRHPIPDIARHLRS